MERTAGRPLEFDPDAALDAAMQQFWRKGYEHTSMEDLLKTMNISKSSLYQAFGNKRALFERSIARYGDQLAGQLLRNLEQAPSGKAFIRGFLESVLAEARGECEARGCLVLNTASEFSQRDPEIAEAVGQELRRFRDVLFEAVKRAKREKEIPADRDAMMLANFLVNSMSGLKTLSKAGTSEETIKGIIGLTLKTLD